ncbi:MAG: choice-of-anchor Q domain-containing protein [Verrucomicrobiia bacterium]
MNSPTDVALRAALTGGGTVTFNCEGTITVTGTLAIASSTVVDATGHAITISGGNAVQLFSVSSGVSASFLNLTLANGAASFGGAIYNNGGMVTLNGCMVVSNTAVAGAGGAIYNLNGNLTAQNSTFAGNHGVGVSGQFAATSGQGGAIFAVNGLVNCVGCTFTANTVIAGYKTKMGVPGFAQGGAIWSQAALSISKCSFFGNQAAGAGACIGDGQGEGSGGAIFFSGATLNLSGSLFANNTAQGASGGTFLSHNCSGGLGRAGAICSLGTLAATNCTFAANSANGGQAEPIYFDGASGGPGVGGGLFITNAAILVNLTFISNNAAGGVGDGFGPGGATGGLADGGAIYNVGTLTTTNCTFAANSATGGRGGPSYFNEGASGGVGSGGGLLNNAGMATLVNLTFAANNAAGGIGSTGTWSGPVGLNLGGAICNSNGTVNLYNTILAYSTSSSNCWGTVSDSGYNLSSDASAGFYAPGSLNNTDPVLGPLGNYGGSTQTLPLLAGSPAIDGGNTATAPATDQRGHARPYGTAADIGAFESSPPYFIGGRVSGYTLKDEVTIVIGSSNLVTTNLGSYGVSAFAAGPYTVTPTSPNYLFIPANLPVIVGPDQFGVNFKAYHWNALSLEAVTNGSMDCIIADTNGQTCRVLSSADLVQWLPVSTNTAGPSNYFETFLPITGEPARFFRTAIP